MGALSLKDMCTGRKTQGNYLGKQKKVIPHTSFKRFLCSNLWRFHLYHNRKDV